MRLRLRTQLILATLIISSAIAGLCLLILRHSVSSELTRQRSEAIASSETAFKRVDREQRIDLQRTATLLSELPTMKALMTSGDAATIQDASTEFWSISGAGLLVLATPDARIMAEHASEAKLTFPTLQRMLATSLRRQEETAWWQEGNSLYRVAIGTIVAGLGSQQRVLGLLVIGQHVNAAFAQQLAASSESQIVLVSGNDVVASTLLQNQVQEFANKVDFRRSPSQQVWLAGHHFDISTVELPDSPNLRCYMLLSLDLTDAYLHRLNRTILLVTLIASIIGGILVSIISRAITEPLESLVGAVHALAEGDDTYRLQPKGGVEAVELANAFKRMRHELMTSQRRQREAERMAALGRAAGSISHDLRHHLAALVANAEFLHDAGPAREDRDGIYQEILRASEQMTGLLDSLLEISRERKTLTVGAADLRCVIDRAMSAVRSSPELHGRKIDLEFHGSMEGEFDARKLERVFFNILLNACEATQDSNGRVGIRITSDEHEFECRIWDTGCGIPESIREQLFEPFVSSGKNNGTGLGLAIAAKIIHDHSGNIHVEETSRLGTTFLLTIPRRCTVDLRDVARAS